MYHLMYSGTVEQHMYEQTLAKLELFERVKVRDSLPETAFMLSEQSTWWGSTLDGVLCQQQAGYCSGHSSNCGFAMT